MLSLKAIEDIIAKCIQEVTKRHAQATTDVHQLTGAAEGIRFVAQELATAHAAAVAPQAGVTIDVGQATPAGSQPAPAPSTEAAAEGQPAPAAD